MLLGVDVFLRDQYAKNYLAKKRLAYLGNDASVCSQLHHSFEMLSQKTRLHWSCLFSPQHGWNVTEQANMIPSDNTVCKNISVFSLYTHETRKLTEYQLDQFDTLLIDLQDVGCRIYTFVTTVLYALKSCSEHNKSVVILDRPNPVGRMIEGSLLNPDFQSVVGVWRIPMRYGLTMGEIAKGYVDSFSLPLDLHIVRMKNYQVGEIWDRNRTWIAPSPNMTDIECALCYSGTVLLEGTLISEGRGTTSPLKIFGFPKMKSKKIIEKMYHLQPDWLKGCVLRPCFFKPTFDKFSDQVCSAIQIHVNFRQVSEFRPYRLMSLFLKSVRSIHPDFRWKLDPPYEYEYEKWPIDILSGDSFLREWIDDSESDIADLEKKLHADEVEWGNRYSSFFLY